MSDHKLWKHIEKVIPLNDDEFAFVGKHFSRKSFKKYQFMVQRGEMVPYNYFLLSGLTKLVYTDDAEKQHILAFAMEDWRDSDFRATRAQDAVSCLFRRYPRDPKQAERTGVIWRTP